MTDDIDDDPIILMLDKRIEANGSGTQGETNYALFVVLKEVYKTLKPIPKRIETLENKSIVVWIEKHPKLTGILAAVLSFVVMTIHELYPRILVWLAIINPLKSMWK